MWGEGGGQCRAWIRKAETVMQDSFKTRAFSGGSQKALGSLGLPWRQGSACHREEGGRVGYRWPCPGKRSHPCPLSFSPAGHLREQDSQPPVDSIGSGVRECREMAGELAQSPVPKGQGGDRGQPLQLGFPWPVRLCGRGRDSRASSPCKPPRPAVVWALEGPASHAWTWDSGSMQLMGACPPQVHPGAKWPPP